MLLFKVTHIALKDTFFQFMDSSEIKPITLLMLVSFAQVTKSVCMVYTVAANESCGTCVIEQTNK